MIGRRGTLGLLLGLLLLTACSGDPTAPTRAEDVSWAASLGIDPADFQGGEGEVRIRVDQAGDGQDPASSGDEVSLRYTGWLANGSQFDSNETGSRPALTFTLGEGRVIRGFEQGTAGMVTGEERTLLIPPALGYGSAGAGDAIPPNAWLVFRIRRI